MQIPAALLGLYVGLRGEELFGPPGLGYGYAVVNVAFMVLLVWGGIAALRGKTNKILVPANSLRTCANSSSTAADSPTDRAAATGSAADRSRIPAAVTRSLHDGTARV